MSGIWGSIFKCGEVSSIGWEVFLRGLGFLLGDGSRVHFWVDEGLGGGPLCLSFPRLFRVVVNKSSIVKKCYVGEEGFVSWVVSFKRVLRESEVSAYESLLSLLSKVRFAKERWIVTFVSHVRLGLSLQDPFARKWSCCQLPDPPVRLFGWVWLPPRVQAFCWLTVSRRVSTANLLKRRGLTSESISDLCSLCGKERETIDH